MQRAYNASHEYCLHAASLMMVKEKYLVIQTAFIGDVVLATGIAEKIHQYYPDAQIDFLVRKGNEGLLSNHPFIRTIVWDKKESKYANLLALHRMNRKQQYKKVINLQRFGSTGFLTAFSKAGETVGFTKNPFHIFFSRKVKHVFSTGKEQVIHEIERNHALIKHFTDDVPAKPKLYPSRGDVEAIKKYTLTPFICIAPSSVWFTKQYPKEKWISFIRAMQQSYRVYLLGGPSDHELCESIKKTCTGKNIVNLCGKLNFLQSAALMQHALMNYVNDSAPMHFASAMDAPVTAVYCSTIPAFGYGPLSTKSFVVETKLPLSCKPCGIHGRKQCPLRHFKCAHTIDDEQLLLTLPSL